MVAPKGQCTNGRRRVRQSLPTCAVFLLDAGYGNGSRNRPGADVRFVGQGVGPMAVRLFRAPQAVLRGSAVTVG